MDSNALVEPENRVARRTMSRNAKICLLALAIVGVLLLVMIPVTIFVIAPRMAQGILDDSTMNITNSTLLPCFNATYEGIIAIEIKAKMPFGARLEPARTTLNYFSPNETLLASYTSPSASVQNGDNHIHQDVRMEFASADGALNFLLLLFGHQPAGLRIRMESVDIKMFGVTLKGLSLKKDVHCRGLGNIQIESARGSPNICGGAPQSGLTGFMMACDPELPTTTKAPAAQTTAALFALSV
jgi:hypothetical protein